MGWIKIDRGLLDSAIWNTGEAFTKGQAWVDLLLSANYEETEQFIGYEVIKIPRGTYMTTIRDLSKRWDWSTSKVLNFLHFLEKQKMLTLKANTKKTLISIVNYENYQSEKNTKKTQSERKANASQTQKENLLYKQRREEGKNIRREPYFDDPDVNQSFCDFIKYRNDGKHPVNDEAIKRLKNKLVKLSGGNPQTMIDIIDQSIENDWRGFFEVRKQKAMTTPQEHSDMLNDILREEYQKSLREGSE